MDGESVVGSGLTLGGDRFYTSGLVIGIGSGAVGCFPLKAKRMEI